MAHVQANGIRIEYETFGSPGDDPLLMVMGLGSQMILWPEELLNDLASRGYYVIRYDNRDVGMSTHFDDAGVPNLLQVIGDVVAGNEVKPPYTIDDMAADAVGLLGALGVERAHVCGASMGGMIAQTLACRHPRLVKSLTSIMSTTGDRSLPPARPEVLSVLMEPMGTDLEAVLERALRVWKTIGSPGFPLDEDMIRQKARLSFERGVNPAGQVRQLTAIVTAPSRREMLRALNVPSLVVHGADDPLIPVEGGRDTAAHIPGAELLVIDGMGHDLPRPIWPQLADAITANARKATTSR